MYIYVYIITKYIDHGVFVEAQKTIKDAEEQNAKKSTAANKAVQDSMLTSPGLRFWPRIAHMYIYIYIYIYTYIRVRKREYRRPLFYSCRFVAVAVASKNAIHRL